MCWTSTITSQRGVFILYLILSIYFYFNGKIIPQKKLCFSSNDLGLLRRYAVFDARKFVKKQDTAGLAINKSLIKMDSQIQLTKKERRELKQQEKLEARETAMQKRRVKRILNWTIIIALVILPIGGLIWYSATQPPIPKSDIVSRNGLHWHPELTIYVKGVKQEIPANIGLGVIEMPIHTHDATGVIHVEMSGLVRKEDIMLSKFFKVWGKDINSFGANLKMTVNGKENTEYGSYVMQDKDKIELRYE